MQRYLGYAFSRPFGDFVMPVPAQNSCMREYVHRRDGLYIPPQLEHKFENCYMQLAGTISSSLAGDFIVIYSFEIIYLNFLKTLPFFRAAFLKSVTVCFVLENFDVKSEVDLLQKYKMRNIRKFIISESELIKRVLNL